MSSRNQAILEAIDSQLQNHTTATSKEPEWIMAIAQGTTPKYHTHSDSHAKIGTGTGEIVLANYCPISEYEFGLTRGIRQESLAHDLIPSGLCAHELKVIASFGSIDASIHSMFLSNQIVDHVILARLVTVTEDSGNASKPGLAVACQYKFEHLYITGLVSQYDSICLSFRYLSLEYLKTSIDPIHGKPAGKSSAVYRSLANLSSHPPSKA